MLGTKNFAKYTEVTDNFYVEWQMYKDLKFIGRFGYTQNRIVGKISIQAAILALQSGRETVIFSVVRIT